MSGEKKSGVIPISFYLGVGLYITSFFLPAAGGLKGWLCAVATLNKVQTMFQSVLFYPGLVNPMMIAFIAAKVLNEAPRLRLCLALGTLGLFIPTWLVVSHMQIMLGCAMWVVSALLMVAEELGSWKI